MIKSAKKQLASWAYVSARAAALDITRWIAHRYGKELGFVYVGGYPKSGTTWVSQQVAYYFDIPFIEHSPPFPQAFRSVIHNHWNYHPALDHSIYVIRDGRDVMVSSYMSAMRVVETRKLDIESFGRWGLVRNLVYHFGKFAHVLRRIERIYGEKFDYWDIQKNLPVFIEAEMTKPVRWSVRETWPVHIRNWREGGKKTVFVKYEELLTDTATVLANVLEKYLESDVDHEEVARAVARYSFERKTGRKPGTEDRLSFGRKGIAGDWQNHFSPEARQVFDHYAGDLLVELGYEPDHAWVHEK